MGSLISITLVVMTFSFTLFKLFGESVSFRPWHVKTPAGKVGTIVFDVLGAAFLAGMVGLIGIAICSIVDCPVKYATNLVESKEYVSGSYLSEEKHFVFEDGNGASEILAPLTKKSFGIVDDENINTIVVDVLEGESPVFGRNMKYYRIRVPLDSGIKYEGGYSIE